MDWFEKLTGFRELGYNDTRAKLISENGRLTSKINGASYVTGTLELASLEALRTRSNSADQIRGRLKVSCITGEARRLHQAPENAGALFQVASQFNLLEMTSSRITPEHGVTVYQNDHTQGPACAIAAGAATIYRNYFVPCGGGEGQTAERQLDALADLGAELSHAMDMPISKLWTMQNGYALATQAGLKAIALYMMTLAPEQVDRLRGKLRTGMHRDVEVTDAPGPNRPFVSQAFCSALPVAYCDLNPNDWEPIATLVLEAAYEATMWAALENALRVRSNMVFLTLLGGGAFGNKEGWIYSAIRRALALVAGFELDVRLVSYGAPSDEMLLIVREFT